MSAARKRVLVLILRVGTYFGLPAMGLGLRVGRMSSRCVPTPRIRRTDFPSVASLLGEGLPSLPFRVTSQGLASSGSLSGPGSFHALSVSENWVNRKPSFREDLLAAIQ